VRRTSWSIGLVLIVMIGGSCTKETIVFRDREPFNTPPEAALGMLGYYDADTKQTTCGNCHSGAQVAWENTKHADAWEDLQASGHASADCDGCHTVSQLGNFIADSEAGYLAVTDSAQKVVYHDVQCESCHGPGLDHVQDTEGVKPLASVVVGEGIANGCGECHSGTHTPFLEQWQESAHGAGASFASRGGSATCAPCHNPRVTMEVAFGEAGTVYAEQDTLAVWPAVYCVTCHDPHGSPYDAQLRAPIDVPTRDNLCVACHARRATPPGGSHGPHAAQGLLVIGEDVGWIPPNFAYDTTLIASSHGTEANPKLCATCHVSAFDVTDAATGDFLLTSVGHTFEPIQCLDAQGLPTAGPCPDAERTFGACVTSGCHVSQDVVRTAFTSLKNDLNSLVDILWTDDGDHVMEATDGGLLPQIIASDDTLELWLGDDIVTVAEGAFYNAQLAYTHDREHWGDGEMWGVHFSAHKASGEGVHNPFLLRALLSASIGAVINTYGPVPPPNVNLTELLKPQATLPPGVRRIR